MRFGPELIPVKKITCPTACCALIVSFQLHDQHVPMNIQSLVKVVCKKICTASACVAEISTASSTSQCVPHKRPKPKLLIKSSNIIDDSSMVDVIFCDDMTHPDCIELEPSENDLSLTTSLFVPTRVNSSNNGIEYYTTSTVYTDEMMEDAFLKEQDDSYVVRRAYLDQRSDISQECRYMLHVWICQVHHIFGFYHDVLHLALNLIDRFLSRHLVKNSSTLSYIAAACLAIAAKYEGRKEEDSSSDTVLSRIAFVTCCNPQQLIFMESVILNTLKFKLRAPTGIFFLRRLTHEMCFTIRQYMMAKYLLDMAIVDYRFIEYRLSLLAASAVYLTRFITQHPLESSSGPKIPEWTPSMRYYSHYIESAILPVAKSMLDLFNNACLNHYPLWHKYAHNDFFKVSLHIPPFAALPSSNLNNSIA